MPEMIALKSLTIKGAMVKAGDRFTITEPSAKLLVAIKKAAYYKESDNAQVSTGESKTDSPRPSSKGSDPVQSGAGLVASDGATGKDDGAKPSWLNPNQVKQTSRKKPGK